MCGKRPAHLFNLFRASHALSPETPHSGSEAFSLQTVRMRKLIWTFAERQCHMTFFMRLLAWNSCNTARLFITRRWFKHCCSARHTSGKDIGYETSHEDNRKVVMLFYEPEYSTWYETSWAVSEGSGQSGQSHCLIRGIAVLMSLI